VEGELLPLTVKHQVKCHREEGKIHMEEGEDALLNPPTMAVKHQVKCHGGGGVHMQEEEDQWLTAKHEAKHHVEEQIQ